MISTDPRQIAWVAGLFEGEGCIYVHPRKPSDCKLTMVMTDEDIVRRSAEVLGIPTRVYLQLRPPYKPAWRWEVKGWRAVLILEAFMPHLGHRRRQKAEAFLAMVQWAAHHCKHGHPRKPGTPCVQCQRSSLANATEANKAAALLRRLSGVCSKGHVLAQVGTRGNGRCLICARSGERESRNRNAKSTAAVMTPTARAGSTATRRAE